MINKTIVVISNSSNPYHNQGLEEYLLNTLKPNTCILYLWQNHNTVVIGKNQNPWQECRIKEMNAEGANLARRLSGGGAVYHDEGNLNFTFILPRQDYDEEKQTSVICQAVQNFGLYVEKTGRNDLTVNGKKFSGNAYFKRKDSAFHHGTLLINSDLTVLARYLNVSNAKLQAKGVRSVSSRVCNLQEMCPEITVDKMKASLTQALESVYGKKPLILTDADFDDIALAKLETRYASWEWRLGRKLPFQHNFTKRYIWGEISFNFSVECGIINDVAVFSDAMDSTFISKLQTVLLNKPYSSNALIETLAKLELKNELGYEANSAMLKDIEDLILEQNF